MSSLRLLVLLLLLSLLTASAEQRVIAQQLEDLAQPTDITCEGYERDTVEVIWNDNNTSETNYRVERMIVGSNKGFEEVATLTPIADRYYTKAQHRYPQQLIGLYRDTHADVSQANRHYRVRAYRASDNSFSDYSEICNNRRIFNSANFRLFYGLRGTDECPQVLGKEVCLTNDSQAGNNIFIQRQASILEGLQTAFHRIGFNRSVVTPIHGLDKLPVNITQCDNGGCFLPFYERRLLALEPALIEASFDVVNRAGDPIAWVLTAHELFHLQQYQYITKLPTDSSKAWILEGQARAIQDKLCINADNEPCQGFDDINTGYAGYVPTVKAYLGDPNYPLNTLDERRSYQSALFWTYLMEQYGTGASVDSVEGGTDFLVKFWEENAAHPEVNDSFTSIDNTLAALGHTARFRDVWKDFTITNYAKDLSGPSVPAKYQYIDMKQPGGDYGPVTLTLSKDLLKDNQVTLSGERLSQWGASYYELRPAADVTAISLQIEQTTATPIFYAVLGIKNNDLIFQYQVEAHHLRRTLFNQGFDKVVIVMAGMENDAYYNYNFATVKPQVRILSPLTNTPAYVGDRSAPGKFRVGVEVVDADDTPLLGLDLERFSFLIDNQPIPTANILTKVELEGQQWFVLRAPPLGSGGHALSVRYETFESPNSAGAIIYTPRPNTDSVLVIDRSGSMGASNKMSTAKAAAKLYVDSWDNGDKIGIVAFDDKVTQSLALTDWTDSPNGGSRQTAMTAIDGLIPGGQTAIGDALATGRLDLKQHGNMDHNWGLVLLSDGLENAGDISFDTMIQTIAKENGKRFPIHTIAVGPDADQRLMQKAADDTEGKYLYIAPPDQVEGSSATINTGSLQLELDSAYWRIAADMVDQQPFFQMVGPTNGNLLNEITIPVEANANELNLALSFGCCFTNGRGLKGVTLLDPAGTQVITSTSIWPRQFVWQIPNPTSGDWKLRITTVMYFSSAQTDNPSAPDTWAPYLVQGALQSDTALDIYLSTLLAQRTSGVPMPILASLSDSGAILGASVTTTVTPPSGVQSSLLLLDDGNHSDGAANDGAYGNIYYQTGITGSYGVEVHAIGNSLDNGVFSRRQTVAFHINSSGDSDGDGLPNEWESRFGTNPIVVDADSDPDIDFSSNKSEWERGTHPLDSDTDDGGESDGVDELPHDPSNDAIDPSWVMAYPGDQQVIVYYRPYSKDIVTLLFRSNDPIGTYSVLSSTLPGIHVFTDTSVINGNLYCYKASALNGFQIASAPLTPACVTPKADPVPPHGAITINGGARTTILPDVHLTLSASDAIGPDLVLPGRPLTSHVSGVTDMIISNQASMVGSVWEPFATTKAWRLGQTTGLATVFVKYRDGAGNESEVIAATIHVGDGPGLLRVYLPYISNQ